MPRAAARTLSTSSSGLVSGEAAMNATIGADGVRVASMPSTIATRTSRTESACASTTAVPMAAQRRYDSQPMSRSVPRYTRTAAAARRALHAADRVIAALRRCATLAASLAPTPARGWLPRAEPILLGRQELRFHDHLELMCAANDPAVGCAASQCGRPM